MAPMAVWSDTNDSKYYEGFSLDEHTKNIAWKNVDFCGKCNPDSPCYGGIQKVIFGKGFDHVCRCTFKFVNPDDKEYECIKKLIMLRKTNILCEPNKDKND